MLIMRPSFPGARFLKNAWLSKKGAVKLTARWRSQADISVLEIVKGSKIAALLISAYNGPYTRAWGIRLATWVGSLKSARSI
jgi:hypothetical protein